MLFLTTTLVSENAAGSIINLELSKKMPPPLLSALLECTSDELIVRTAPNSEDMTAIAPPLPANSIIIAGLDDR